MTESSSATAAIDNDEGAKTRKGHEYESRLHQGQNIGELKAVVGKDVRYEYITQEEWSRQMIGCAAGEVMAALRACAKQSVLIPPATGPTLATTRE